MTQTWQHILQIGTSQVSSNYIRYDNRQLILIRTQEGQKVRD